MHVIDLNAATAGMRLAKAIYNRAGKIIIPEGELLTTELLALLKRLNVARIAVQHMTETPVPSAEVPPASAKAERLLAQPDDLLDAITEAVLYRFRLNPIDLPQAKVIFDLAVERETRLQLSRPTKTAFSGIKAQPAFQTPKPVHIDLEKFIDSTLTLGTLPLVFHKLVEIINNPNSSSQDAAQVIATDPALAAKLLKLVNSAFYGLPVRVDTISRAVTLIGTGQLVMLAMGATLITAFKGMPVSLISMQSFWTHSLACGVTARILANRLGFPQPESYFISGLLHDIARLVIYSQLPEHALYLITESKRQQVTIKSMEQDILGFTHEELGKKMLEVWRCSDDLIERVAQHHMPVTADSPLDLAILPMADFFAHALNYGSSGEAITPPITPETWNRNNVAAQDIPDLVMGIDKKLRELRSLFISE